MIMFQHQYTCTMQITDQEIQEIALRHGPQGFAVAVSKELAPIMTGMRGHIAGTHQAIWDLKLAVPNPASTALDVSLTIVERQPLLTSLWWAPLNVANGVFKHRIKHACIQEVRIALLFAIGKVCKRQQKP